MNSSCGGGRFHRDPEGVWRYGPQGMAVFGAQDMTWSNYFDFPSSDTAAGPVVHVARGLAMEHSSLSWCLEWDRGGPTIDVPVEDWDRHDEVIGVWAPELQEEGGIRGMMFDHLIRQDAADPFQHLPVAPHRPPPSRVRQFSLLERDIRRKIRAGEPIKFKKGWIPWWDRPRTDGTFRQ